METRRKFLTELTAAGVCAWLAAGALAAQHQFPAPKPTPDQLPTKEQPPPDHPDPSKAALEENDKDMKKKVERLYQLATELKTEVDKTDSSKVMSLNLMKKAEEIERLAREIKNRSKG